MEQEIFPRFVKGIRFEGSRGKSVLFGREEDQWIHCADRKVIELSPYGPWVGMWPNGSPTPHAVCA